jgi:uncharacterized membrane protein YidH (DUF202 family)
MSDWRVFDAGLQPERTLLAWHRTCLVLGLGVAASIRFGAVGNPLLAILLGLPALAILVAAYALTSVRYRTATTALVNDPRAAVAGGRAITIVAMVASVIAVVAAVYVVNRSAVFA